MDRLESMDTRKYIIFHLALTLLLCVVLLSMGFGKFKLNTAAVLDTTAFYGMETFYSNLALLGQEGRISYLFLHLFDYLFIIHFYPLLIFFLFVLFSRNKVNERLKPLSLLPLIAGGADFFENICIDVSLLNYPRKIPLLGWAAGFFTGVKFGVLYLVFTLLVVLTILWVRRRVR